MVKSNSTTTLYIYVYQYSENNETKPEVIQAEIEMKWKYYSGKHVSLYESLKRFHSRGDDQSMFARVVTIPIINRYSRETIATNGREYIRIDVNQTISKAYGVCSPNVCGDENAEVKCHPREEARVF